MGKVALQGQLESRGWEMGKQEQNIVENVTCAEMRQLLPVIAVTLKIGGVGSVYESCRSHARVCMMIKINIPGFLK